ncbi:CHY zinc finger protein [Dietzia sp. B32]|uniref:CHY zinc finger protein n=1 Tax=Dietzia sp. B32 TaxID=2915130 RepID=UPI0021AE3013|nr:CHY zinc finger protein [Dietzia sp. B32]UVE94354.1 CHY zinc finger protein [Dietzia sp. B32]
MTSADRDADDGRDAARPAAVTVLGATVDDQTRCIHYRGPLDIVAIRFHCCGEFYPCFRCHAETVDHPISAWPTDRFDEHAILCGACRSTLSISSYLDADACPSCASPFNPGCSLHHSIYFE